jgi:ribosomal protein S18 acetylase RimI-like enzyme
MDVNSFSEALISVYVENPCSIQPNALWKTLNEIDNFRNNFEMENSKVVKLMLWNEKELLIYWDRNSFYIDIDRDKLSKFSKITVHETQLTNRINSMFPKRESYFRLMHNLKNISKTQLPRDYYFLEVNMPGEAEIVSELISTCYVNIKINKDEVINWTKRPVYNKSLWIWIMNKKNDKPVGLGIAEEDYILKEGAIEYILVLPEYRDIGLGRSLILELINTLENRVNYVTVSGKIDNQLKLEDLFRKCGFKGNDIWYVIKAD